MSNIFPHSRSLQFHAAARHVMRLACERAVLRGALRPDDSFDLQAAARCKMHTAQVRQATELVLQLTEAHKVARQQERLLPGPQLEQLT